MMGNFINRHPGWATVLAVVLVPMLYSILASGYEMLIDAFDGSLNFSGLLVILAIIYGLWLNRKNPSPGLILFAKISIAALILWGLLSGLIGSEKMAEIFAWTSTSFSDGTTSVIEGKVSLPSDVKTTLGDTSSWLQRFGLKEEWITAAVKIAIMLIVIGALRRYIKKETAPAENPASYTQGNWVEKTITLTIFLALIAGGVFAAKSGSWSATGWSWNPPEIYDPNSGEPVEMMDPSSLNPDTQKRLPSQCRPEGVPHRSTDGTVFDYAGSGLCFSTETGKSLVPRTRKSIDRSATLSVEEVKDDPKCSSPRGTKKKMGGTLQFEFNTPTCIHITPDENGERKFFKIFLPPSREAGRFEISLAKVQPKGFWDALKGDTNLFKFIGYGKADGAGSGTYDWIVEVKPEGFLSLPEGMGVNVIVVAKSATE